MLSPQSEINECEREGALQRLGIEAAFSNTTAALTTGAILAAFALHLGANNFTIGLLAAIPFLTQIAQLPAIWLIERYRARKRIAVISSVIGRSMLGVMALLPFAEGLALPGLFATTLILCLMGAIGGCAWNAWMRDLTPDERMGRVFARRTLYATVTLMIAGLAAGIGLQFSGSDAERLDLTFSILYLAGCISGMISAAIAARLPEPRMSNRVENRIRLWKIVRAPLANRNFRQLMIFICWWQFAVNLATPFFTVFFINSLGYGMGFVMVLTIVSQIANALMLGNWGRLTDRFNNRSVLMVSAPVYIFCIVAMIGASQFAYTDGRDAWLIALHILMGSSLGGTTLAMTNIALKLSPRGESTAYIATSGLASSVAAGSAPIIGGLLADFFAVRQLAVSVNWTNPDATFALFALELNHWDFFFLLSGIVGLIALHRLSSVEEAGDIEQKQMVRQIFAQTRSSINNLSTVPGLRALTEIPESIFRDAKVHARWLRIKQSAGVE
ncbi:MAG: MFS transporter [Sphingomonadaceae bacterium]|nr:MFS transporter [Sphingomonadaceae bacterium]